MVLQFCPVCKNLLKIKTENDKPVGVCDCGFKRTIFELNSQDNHLDKKEFKEEGIVKEEDSNGISKICKKCNYPEAEMIEVNRTISEESEIKYLTKCKKCGFVQDY